MARDRRIVDANRVVGAAPDAADAAGHELHGAGLLPHVDGDFVESAWRRWEGGYIALHGFRAQGHRSLHRRPLSAAKQRPSTDKSTSNAHAHMVGEKCRSLAW